MLILKSLVAENFRSWKHLEISNFNRTGLTLINAPNGYGKSSIRHLIEFVLLDKTSDNLPLSELPYNSGKNCKLNLVLERDNDTIDITKYRNHEEFGNNTILNINGDDSLTTTDRRETQKNIETLLDVNERELFASTIFTQNTQTFAESKESDRKDLLYNILDLEKYKIYNLLVSTKIKEVEDSIEWSNKIRDEKIRLIEGERERIKVLVNKKEQFEKDRIESIALYKEKIDNIKQCDITQLKEALTELESKKDEHDLRKLLDEIGVRCSIKEKELYQLEVALNRLNDEIDAVKGKWCPILNIDCEKLGVRALDIEQKNEPKIKTVKQNINRVKNELKELNHMKNELMKKPDISLKIEKLKSEIGARMLDNNNSEKVAKQYKNYIVDLEEQSNPYLDLIREAESEVKDLEREVEDIKEKLKKINDDKPYYTFWADGFGKQGIPNIKMEGFLEELEAETNRVLSTITNDMFVSIEAQTELKSKETREKISYKIKSPNKKIEDFHSYSGGERQRIKLADIFAFNKLIGKFNFILFDEALEGSLDYEGKDSVIDMLRAYSSEIESIYVISHSKQIKDRFDNIINIGMKEGISYVS